MTRDQIGLLGSGWEIIGDNIDCDRVWAEKGHEGLLTRDKSRTKVIGTWAASFEFLFEFLLL